METHEFDIAINPDGTVRVLVQGTKGPVCEKYAELFQNILAGETVVERTAEYYAPPTGVEINLEQRA
ncbi:MAG: DUF2997 domain-containing protein [Planctomycetota bacterium]|nr:DUF2997 domain-containing protein [Planctomycetota bacterium]